MSFVFTSTTTLGACALRVALIGRSRLRKYNRTSQSNRCDSSYCHCLKPFVHLFPTPKSFIIIQGSVLTRKTPLICERLQQLKCGSCNRYSCDGVWFIGTEAAFKTWK